jgi:hypothetical protein
MYILQKYIIYKSASSLKIEILNLGVCVVHVRAHTLVFYGKRYSLNETVETHFVARIKNVERNVKQQNINKAMILINSLNITLTCRQTFISSQCHI